MRGAVLIAALLCVSSPSLALADEDQAARQDGGRSDEIFLEGDRQTCDDPPLRVTRPNDSWQFVNLETAKRQARKKGEDTSTYATLKFRLWYGKVKANIFVYAYVDELPRKEPPTPEELALEMIDQLQTSLVDMRVKSRNRTRVGKRTGVLFEIEGRAPHGTEPRVIMKAVVYRPEDKMIVTFSLEGPARDAKTLRKDFKKTLRKARI